ncbi:MAG: hypothetical protein IMF00_02770 [Proteobacteria bacterium]|nr:hypothetical protein [Pseudomonadota bacterium]
MTVKKAMRKFTDEGIEQFRKYLAELREGATSPAPFHLLNDPVTSKPVNAEIQIENREFATRLELAQYLDDALAEIESDSIETDVYLWSWLSLFYFNQVCPPQKDGTRKPGRDYRHILEPGYPYGHNHLLAGAYLVYTVYSLNDDLSKLLLYTTPYIESGFHHQLAQRQSIITNKGLMEAAHLLYINNQEIKPKFGAIARNKAGTLYRFIDVIQQLDLNYDLYSMTGEEVLQLLPAEFNKWKGQKPLR